MKYLTFKKYPPSWIPLKYWVSGVNSKNETECYVLLTLKAWLTRDNQLKNYNNEHK